MSSSICFFSVESLEKGLDSFQKINDFAVSEGLSFEKENRLLRGFILKNRDGLPDSVIDGNYSVEDNVVTRAIEWLKEKILQLRAWLADFSRHSKSATADTGKIKEAAKEHADKIAEEFKEDTDGVKKIFLRVPREIIGTSTTTTIHEVVEYLSTVTDGRVKELEGHVTKLIGICKSDKILKRDDFEDTEKLVRTIGHYPAMTQGVELKGVSDPSAIHTAVLSATTNISHKLVSICDQLHDCIADLTARLEKVSQHVKVENPDIGLLTGVYSKSTVLTNLVKSIMMANTTINNYYRLLTVTVH